MKKFSFLEGSSMDIAINKRFSKLSKIMPKGSNNQRYGGMSKIGFKNISGMAFC